MLCITASVIFLVPLHAADSLPELVHLVRRAAAEVGVGPVHDQYGLSMELRQPLAAVAVDQELRELEVGDDGSDSGLVLVSAADRRCECERGGEEDR